MHADGGPKSPRGKFDMLANMGYNGKIAAVKAQPIEEEKEPISARHPASEVKLAYEQDGLMDELRADQSMSWHSQFAEN